MGNGEKWDVEKVAVSSQEVVKRDTIDNAGRKHGKAGEVSGTRAIYHIWPDFKIRALINKSVSSDIIKEAAIRNGMKTLWQDGLWKVKTGITDLKELMANVRADGDRSVKE